MTIQPDDPISFMQLTAKNEMSSKEDQFQLSLLAAMGNTQRKEAADPLASKLNKVVGNQCFIGNSRLELMNQTMLVDWED